MSWLNEKWNDMKFAINPRNKDMKLLLKIAGELVREIRKNSIHFNVGAQIKDGVLINFLGVTSNNVGVEDVLRVKSIFKNVANKHGWEYVDAPVKDILEGKADELNIRLKL